MITKADIWLWVAIDRKRKLLDDKLEDADHHEFKVAEQSITFNDVADNDSFVETAKNIVRLYDK
jgi:hypothetical protein